MINKSHLKIGLAVFLTLLCFSSIVFAQSSKINWTRMQRDLNIMESILDKLLSESGSGLQPVIAGFSNNGAKGLYFDGYGVVFQISLGASGIYNFSVIRLEETLRKAQIEIMRKDLLAPPKPEEPVIVVEGRSGVITDKKDWSVEKRLERLKEQGTEFLCDYADAIGQLQNSDRITLLINFDQSRSQVFRFMTRGSGSKVSKSEKLPSGLEIAAKKSDIIDFRKGKIGKKEFQKRLVFKKRLDSSRNNKNIEIMANILSTALNRKYHQDFSSEGKNRGIYVSGLGALFFMRGQLFREREMIEYTFYLEKYLKEQEEIREVAVAPKPTKTPPADKLRETLDNFKNELIELIGDYGHTLRTIKPSEHVVISIDFNDRLHFNLKTPTHIILKVRKEELDKYDRGDLSLAALRKKVEVQEY